MTVRDKTGLASQIADLLADNNTRDISEADLRSVATDIVDSLALDTSVPDVDDLVESVTLSGTTVTVTKQDGTTSTFEIPDSVADGRLLPGWWNGRAGAHQGERRRITTPTGRTPTKGCPSPTRTA